MEDYAGYFRTMVGHLWSWADRWHRNELAGGNRQRPPVQRPEFASKTVLAPAHADRAREIRAALPEERRHKWFRSHRSSQALTQSVFAAVRAFGRTDILDIPAECGRPAFCEAPHRASLALEYQLQTLREPEPTSVDVLLEHPSYRVAVECKLMEREFGVCSRPELKPGNYSYDQQYCDGDYHTQRGRTVRCSLTEIGIRYWTYLPRLFEWDPERDLRPCPFAPVYQIARNALAATLNTRREARSALGTRPRRLRRAQPGVRLRRHCATSVRRGGQGLPGTRAHPPPKLAAPRGGIRQGPGTRLPGEWTRRKVRHRARRWP